MPGDKQFDGFRAAEHNALRVELVSHIEAIKGIETEAVIGVAAIFSWLLSEYQGDELAITIVVALMPTLFVFINLTRVRDRQRRIDRIVHYVKSLEEHFGAEIEACYQGRQIRTKGWENFRLNIERHASSKGYDYRLLNAVDSYTAYPLIVEMYHRALWPLLISSAGIASVLLIVFS